MNHCRHECLTQNSEFSNLAACKRSIRLRKTTTSQKMNKNFHFRCDSHSSICSIFFFFIRCLCVLLEYAIDNELDTFNYFNNFDLDHLNNRRIRFSIKFFNVESNIKTFHITMKHFAQTIRIFLFVRFDYD